MFWEFQKNSTEDSGWNTKQWCGTQIGLLTQVELGHRGFLALSGEWASHLDL
jgi:hypothetical protein